MKKKLSFTNFQSLKFFNIRFTDYEKETFPIAFFQKWDPDHTGCLISGFSRRASRAEYGKNIRFYKGFGAFLGRPPRNARKPYENKAFSAIRADLDFMKSYVSEKLLKGS